MGRPKKVKEEDKKFGISEKWGTIFGKELLTPVGRVNYVHLKTPDAFGSYSLVLMVEKNNEKARPRLQAIQAMFSEMIAQEERDPEDFKYLAIRDGDKEKQEVFKGHWILPCKSKDMVDVVSFDDRKRINDSLILAGVKCRCIVQPRVSEKALSLHLVAVQLVEDDGVRLYAGPNPLTLFDDYEDVEVKKKKSAIDTFDVTPKAEVKAEKSEDLLSMI